LRRGAARAVGEPEGAIAASEVDHSEGRFRLRGTHRLRGQAADGVDGYVRVSKRETPHERKATRKCRTCGGSTTIFLRAMRYEARLTRFSGDGGVDVIAHRDAFGAEPPLIKVQCKQTTSKIGGHDAQRLVSARGNGALGTSGGERADGAVAGV